VTPGAGPFRPEDDPIGSAGRVPDAAAFRSEGDPGGSAAHAGPFRPEDDPIGTGAAGTVRIEVAGEPVDGIAGQTIAGILLAGGRLSWRRSRTGRPRGVFCGIGVCFDCVVVVNGLRDVRACQRRAADGDRVEFQEDDHG
jgi:hypothetical protein